MSGAQATKERARHSLGAAEASVREIFAGCGAIVVDAFERLEEPPDGVFANVRGPFSTAACRRRRALVMARVYAERLSGRPRGVATFPNRIDKYEM